MHLTWCINIRKGEYTLSDPRILQKSLFQMVLGICSENSMNEFLL